MRLCEVTREDGPDERLILRAPVSPAEERALQREARAMVTLGRVLDEPPCPRVIDKGAGDAGAFLVTEPWGHDLERWWAARAADPDAFWALCNALAEVCETLADAHAALGSRPEVATVAPLVDARTVARGSDGRWVFLRFEDLQRGAGPGGDEAAPRAWSRPGEAPEILFGSAVTRPMAVHAWAVGETFFALLRMRGRLRAGARLPPEGIDAPAFHTHQAALVAELAARKPGLFRGRPIDGRHFLYPDRLPDADRQAVAEAVADVLGDADRAPAGRITRAALDLLDRALAGDPARRFVEPLELAGAFRDLGRRFQALRADLVASRTPPPPPDEGETQIMLTGAGPLRPAPRKLAGDDAAVPAGEASAPASGARPPSPAPAGGPEPPGGAAPGRAGEDELPEGGEMTRQDETPRYEQTRPMAVGSREPALEARIAALEARRGVPLWLVGAILALGAVHLVELGMIGWLTWQVVVRAPGGAGEAVALPSPTAKEVPVPPVEQVDEEAAALETEAAPAGAPAEVEPASDGAEVPPAPEATPRDEPPAVSEVPAAPARAVPEPSPRSARSKPRRRRVARSAPEPAEEVPAEGILRVIGGTAWLQGADGRHEPGVVPAGHYTLMAAPDGASPEDLGAVEVGAGDTLVVRCGFGTCRVE